jgi:hypothetical protein
MSFVVRHAVRSAVEALEARRLLSAALTLVNPDILPSNDRLIFDRIQNPDPSVPNVTHDTNGLILENTGDAPLTLNSLTISGPWQLINAPAGGYAGTQIAAGSSTTVTLQFTQSSLPPRPIVNGAPLNETNDTIDPNGGAVITGSLAIASNAANTPLKAVTLAGYWQNQSEHGDSPGVATQTNLLDGYQTVIATQQQLQTESNGVDLNNEGATPTYYGQEVVANSWVAADPTQPITVQKSATFDAQGIVYHTYWYSTATLNAHLLLTGVANQGQTVLPTTGAGQLMVASFTPDGPFGFKDDNLFSDDAQNVAAGNTIDDGHVFRFWPLIDTQGNAVPNTWIMAVDHGPNIFDYSDAVYIVSNMQPGPNAHTPPSPTNLTASNDANPVLNWTGINYANLAGYNVYRATSPSGPFTKLTATPTINTTFTDDASPPGGVTLYYRVTAVDSLTSQESAPATAQTHTPGGPIAASYAVNAFTAVATPINLLVNDTDATGTIVPSTLSIVAGPNHGGTVSIDTSTGVATYTSAAGFTGTETFTYHVSDSNGDTSTPGTVTVTVSNPIVLSPHAQDLSATTLANHSVVITPQAFDSSGNLITPASILLIPAGGGTSGTTITTAHGTATVNADGTITYTPSANFVGGDSFSYSVTDSHGHTSNKATVDASAGVEINTTIKTGARVLVYTDQSGTATTISLSRGIADVFFDGVGSAPAAPVRGRLSITGNSLHIHSIALSATTAASVLSINSKINGNVALGGITDSSPIGVIVARTSNLTSDGTVGNNGALDIAGARVILLKSAPQSQWTIGSGISTIAAVVVAGGMDAAIFSSAARIATLSVGSWINIPASTGALSAPSIGTLVSKGEFDPDVTLTGSGAAPTLGFASIAGKVNGGTWAVTGNARMVVLSTASSNWAGASVSGNLGILVVRSALSTDLNAGSIGRVTAIGALSGDITSDGDITAIIAASMNNSLVTAGAVSSSFADVTTAAQLGENTIHAVVLTSRAASAFSDSAILAHTLKMAKLGKVNMANATATGLAAASFGSVSLTANEPVALGPSQLASEAALAGFLAGKGVAFGNFQLKILS